MGNTATGTPPGYAVNPPEGYDFWSVWGPGPEFQPLEFTLFGAGDSFSFDVNIYDDNLVEADEDFTVNFAFATDDYERDIILDGEAQAVIQDDDSAILSVGDVTIAEGDSGVTSLNFLVSLSNPVDYAVQFSAATADGTATVADGDYTAVNQSYVISAGDSNVMVTVDVLGNTVSEIDETLQLVLSNLNAGGFPVTFEGGGSSISATGTILDDDIAATMSISDASVVEGNSGSTLLTFTATLSNTIENDVTFEAQVIDGTASRSDLDFTFVDGTYTISTGQLSRNITVEILGDTKVESAEDLQL
ncbi:MAG TPA: hypothetical protein DCY03_30400, partial [Planctomycetaceae bacterium]|nr:hypothetical protein [Planctomycetaceae bacterium]